MYLGSSVKSFSFCFLLNNHNISMISRKSKLNNATAIEKSRLIIFGRKIDFYGPPVIWNETRLLYKKIVLNIAHT